MKKKTWTLTDIEYLITNKGGTLLPGDYDGFNVKFVVRCKFGHIWKTTFGHLKTGKWCPRCMKNRTLTLLDAKLAAYIKDGECLSTKMINGAQKIYFRCKFGHIWKASLYRIIGGRWCNKCCGNKKLSQSFVAREIRKRGGELLSEYTNDRSKLTIKCKKGHIFYKAFSKIIHRHQWCNLCFRHNISENICRLFLERVLQTSFPTVRLNWLEGLELDGYSSRLNLAFEHQGPQHYSEKIYKGMFPQDPDAFVKTQERDLKKIGFCKENKVNLIIIPDLFSMTGLKNLGKLLETELEKLQIKPIIDPKDIDVEKLILDIYNKETLRAFKRKVCV